MFSEIGRERNKRRIMIKSEKEIKKKNLYSKTEQINLK